MWRRGVLQLVDHEQPTAPGRGPAALTGPCTHGDYAHPRAFGALGGSASGSIDTIRRTLTIRYACTPAALRARGSALVLSVRCRSRVAVHSCRMMAEGWQGLRPSLMPPPRLAAARARARWCTWLSRGQLYAPSGLTPRPWPMCWLTRACSPSHWRWRHLQKKHECFRSPEKNDTS